MTRKCRHGLVSNQLTVYLSHTVLCVRHGNPSLQAGESAERVEQPPSLECTYRDVVIHHTVRNERSEQAPGTAMCNRRAVKSSPLERIVEVGPPQRSSAVRCTKTGLNQAGGDVKHRRPGLGHRVNPNQKQSWKSKPPRAARPTSDQARGR